MSVHISPGCKRAHSSMICRCERSLPASRSKAVRIFFSHCTHDKGLLGFFLSTHPMCGCYRHPSRSSWCTQTHVLLPIEGRGSGSVRAGERQRGGSAPIYWRLEEAASANQLPRHAQAAGARPPSRACWWSRASRAPKGASFKGALPLRCLLKVLLRSSRLRCHPMAAATCLYTPLPGAVPRL